jgi:hypothetical protein
MKARPDVESVARTPARGGGIALHRWRGKLLAAGENATES